MSLLLWYFHFNTRYRWYKQFNANTRNTSTFFWCLFSNESTSISWLFILFLWNKKPELLKNDKLKKKNDSLHRREYYYERIQINKHVQESHGKCIFQHAQTDARTHFLLVVCICNEMFMSSILSDSVVVDCDCAIWTQQHSFVCKYERFFSSFFLNKWNFIFRELQILVSERHYRI